MNQQLPIFDQQYVTLLKLVLEQGELYRTRGTESLYRFGDSIKVNLLEGFPLTTLRYIRPDMVLAETLWDLSGGSELDSLGSARHFWANYDNGHGYVSGSYGRAWRSFPALSPDLKVPGEKFSGGDKDQLMEIAEGMRTNPDSRQFTLQTYMPGVETPCPPCHPTVTFSVSPANSDGTRYLDARVLSRSQDLSVGFPTDVPRYAILLHALARYAGLTARFLVFDFTNLHIYANNVEHAKKLIERANEPDQYKAPRLYIGPVDFMFLDDLHIGIQGYSAHPPLRPNFN